MTVHVELDLNAPNARSESWRSRLATARMFGVRAWWCVTPDLDEVGRRRGAHLPCLRRLEVVDVLLNLPIGIPVAHSSLSRREKQALANLPRFIFDWHGTEVVRRACPPLRIHQVLVSARTFRRGLESASSFSTYCSRSMVLASDKKPSAIELAEAGYYGVGVYLEQRTKLLELVAPEPLPAWPETAASWVFNETLADRLR